MITIEKPGEHEPPQLFEKSIENTDPAAPKAPDTQSGPQQIDGTLLASRALALMALATGAYMLLHPSAETYIVSGVLVTSLFTVNHWMQNKQKEKALDAALTGLSVKLPTNSAIWDLALPFIASVTPFLLATCVDEKVNGTSLARWLMIASVSILCPLISWSLPQAEKHPRILGLAKGLTLGSALAILALLDTSMAVNLLDSHAGGINFRLLVAAMLPLLVIVHNLHLTKKLLFKVPRQKAASVFSFALAGASLMCLFGVVPELRSAAVGAGERLASDSDNSRSQLGYRLLKQLNAAGDLERDSLPWDHARGSFISALVPFNCQQAQHEYFMLTGKKVAYRPAHSAGQAGFDADLGNQKIGQLRPGLSLGDSQITGIVDADSLTSSLYWTMTFANDCEQAEEARAQIALPKGAAVSRVTLWINGIEQEAAFNSTQAVQQAYQWIVQHHRDPLLVTETESGKVFLQAYPVPKWGEMKVRIGITAPLEMKSPRQFRLEPPRIVTANFTTDSARTDVKLESNAPIEGNAEEQSIARGKTLTGTLKPGSCERYQFMFTRQNDFQDFTVRATHSLEHSFIAEKLITESRPLRKLAIVIDGSLAVGRHADDLCRSLAKVPHNIESEIIVASRQGAQKESLSPQALTNLRHFRFDGGCDDTEALLAAKQFIGSEKGSAILWVHGQQPFVMGDDPSTLKHLMRRGEHRLKIYDYQIESDQPDQIKDYLVSLDADACPEFNSIFQTGSVENDLNSFVSETIKAARNCRIVREKVKGFTAGSIEDDPAVASRVSTLWAADQARKSSALGDTATAVQLGTAYRIVTPATGAVVLETQSDYDRNALNRNMYAVVASHTHAPAGTADGTSTLSPIQNATAAIPAPSALGTVGPQSSASSGPTIADAFSSAGQGNGGNAGLFNSYSQAQQGNAVAFSVDAPQLQGTTNGTIGPQGRDATYITGVNTAGAVRQNNLANLEALLNIIATGIEIIGSVAGVYLIIAGFRQQEAKKAVKLCAKGATFFLLAIATPSIVNTLIALARDANLLS